MSYLLESGFVFGTCIYHFVIIVYANGTGLRIFRLFGEDRSG